MKRVFALALLAGTLSAAPAAGQAAPPPPQHFLAVGTMAPDITLTGATKYGIIQAPIKLSDFRGEPVVLAFFFRARTRG
jgi:thioredoxin-dependent peroxiredoxin